MSSATTMLTGVDLLNLDPDQLLKNYSVEQAEQVARKLQKEVDSKREELRVMVGERYRDLIEAADTIQKMKISSLSVMDGLTNMNKSCNNLQEKSISSYTTQRQQAKRNSCDGSGGVLGPARVNLPYLAVAASMKLIMWLPENIWAAVERGKLTQSGELYLLAQYVETGLQMDQGGGVSAERVEQWFPVLSRQFATINNFQSSIISSARDQMMTVDLKCEDALDACGSMLLLARPNDNKADDSNPINLLASLVNRKTAPESTTISAEHIFREFLSIRRECLRACAESSRSDAAKAAICRFLRGVITTVKCIEYIFCNRKNEGSGLHRLVENFTGSSGEPTVSYLGVASLGPTAKYLPEPIRNFKPKVTHQEIPHDVIVRLTVDWLESMQTLANEEASHLLEHISTVHGVAAIREETYQLLSSEEYQYWDSAIQAVTDNNLNLWESFYRDRMRSKLEEIINTDIHQHLAALEEAFNKKLAQSVSECNLGAYIWSEVTADIAGVWKKQSGLHESKDVKKMAGLAVKCRGWSSEIQELLSTLNSGLLVLWNAVSNYNKDDTIQTNANSESFNLGDGDANTIESSSIAFDRHADSAAIFAYLSEQLSTCLQALIARLAQNASTNPQDDTTASLVSQQLFLARFLQAFPDLSPTIKLCVNSSVEKKTEAHEWRHTPSSASNRGTAASPTPWDLLNRHVISQANSAFSSWAQHLVKEQFTSRLETVDDDMKQNPLDLFPAWDKISVKETGDDGAEVTSEITVPTVASPQLARSLHNLAAHIHRAQPVSLPGHVLLNIIKEVSERMLSWCGNVMDGQGGRLTQNTAIQLAFNIRFIQTGFLAREFKDEMEGRIVALLERAESNIDPFDLSVFTPHIQSRVKRACLREVSGLGCLIPVDRLQMLTASSSGVAQQQQDLSNLIALPTAPPPSRFQLLPISSPGLSMTSAGFSVKLLESSPRLAATSSSLNPASLDTNKLATATPNSSKKRGGRSRSPVASTAASFFGSMGSSWFGGSSNANSNSNS